MIYISINTNKNRKTFQCLFPFHRFSHVYVFDKLLISPSIFFFVTLLSEILHFDVGHTKYIYKLTARYIKYCTKIVIKIIIFV